MKVTVILCTYNRSSSLAKALESVARSDVPEAIQWEVLVVDNNSMDSTGSVVAEYCRRDSRFRYLFEPRQGKSFALNTGCLSTNADVLAFVDDDVEVDRNWLSNLVAPFACRDWDGVGGRVLPEVGFTPQRWMDIRSPRGLAPLAMFDLGMAAGELREPPFGNNMAFRKEVFAKFGGFRTDLGPQPGSEIRDEDTEFGSRLLAAGNRLWYEPSAVVYHAIPAKRNSQEYFQTWWFDKGRAEVRTAGLTRDYKWTFLGIPLLVMRRFVMWSLRWMLSVNQPRRSECKFKLWWLAGAILEHYKQAHPLREFA